MAGNWRVAIAFAFIGAMVVALVLLLLPDGDDPVAATTSLPSTTTTTSSPTTTTSTTVAETTTTSMPPGDRLAEVERILEELYVGWYDAIYRKDETQLGDVVAIQLLYDAATRAMETEEFVAPPTRLTVSVSIEQIILDRPDCLVVHRHLDLSQTLADPQESLAVQILWPREDGSYRLARLWSSPADLWQDDCDLMDRTEIP